MGSDPSEVQDSPTLALGIKVHLSMCNLLLGLVDRILKILPDIEESRPRSQGIDALCQLRYAIDKAKTLVESCRLSSKLYLAIIGETVKSRFERTKNILDQNLSLLQNMVPVALGSQISEILNDLRALKFIIDSCEDLAGKALRAMLQQEEFPVNSQIDLLQFAAAQLNLKSAKDLLIETRCLRKMLNDVKVGNSTKRKTLKYLCYLLKKYDQLILQGQTRNSSLQLEAFISVESDSNGITTESPGLNYQNSDRSSVTSICGSLETSSNSIRSTASSMKDIDLRIDMSNLSLGSLDSSYSNVSHTKFESHIGSIKESIDVEYPRFQFFCSIDDIRTHLLSNIRGFSWEQQCDAIQDVHSYLINHNPSCAFVSSENFLDPLMGFLQDALYKHDKEAQKAGNLLFLTLLRSSRWESLHTSEDVYSLVASFLATEPTAETLAIAEVLSTQSPFSKFAESNTFCTSILKILGSHKMDLQESALRLLYNFSSSIDKSSCYLALDWIPTLVHFLEDSSVAGTCLGILENLCKFEETRHCIAETHGCIASIVKLLENCTQKDQEHAVGIFLTLCSQNDYYCELVLSEGCIPLVVEVSNIGSDKGRVIASELLRQLKEFSHQEFEKEHPKSNVDVSKDRVGSSNPKSSKTSSGFFRKLLKKK